VDRESESGVFHSTNQLRREAGAVRQAPVATVPSLPSTHNESICPSTSGEVTCSAVSVAPLCRRAGMRQRSRAHWSGVITSATSTAAPALIQ
jgi:hypothetical protein